MTFLLPDTLDGWGETDVREEIIAPLLRDLDYGSGRTHSVIREQTLRYPRAYLGRKKPDTDGIIRGRADYVCTAGDRVRWTIEAKAPCVEVSDDDIDQAYSYANHPEIRAVYFVICNGNHLDIYQTNSGPSHPPRVSVSLADMRQSVSRVAELLAPSRVLADWPEIAAPTGEPLGFGLRSIMRIVSGNFHYNPSNLPGSQVLTELQYWITDGMVQRQDDGSILAEVRIPTGLRSLSVVIRQLGLEWQTFVTRDSVLSRDPARPTVLETSQEFELPAGTPLPFGQGRLPASVQVRNHTIAKGWLEPSMTFQGTFQQTTRTNVSNAMAVTGTFSLCLG